MVDYFVKDTASAYKKWKPRNPQVPSANEYNQNLEFKLQYNLSERSYKDQPVLEVQNNAIVTVCVLAIRFCDLFDFETSLVQFLVHFFFTWSRRQCPNRFPDSIRLACCGLT